MVQNWAKGGTGKAKTSTKYVKGYADGGFISGLAEGAATGYNLGSDRKKKKASGTQGTEGTTGTETAASSTTTGENLPSILKPEGNES